MRSRVGRRALTVAVATAILLAVLAVPPSPAVAQEEADEVTTFGFDLREDGDAHVSVTTEFVLSTDTDREGFDRLAEAHTGGEGSPLSAGPFERAADLSAEANGRPMEIRGISRTAGRTNDTGQLTLQFTWTNFTEPRDGRLSVGDAFRTPDGTWLPGLAADQELVISFPSGYTPQSISVPGTRYRLVNGTVRIEGPASFESGTPTLVLQQTGGPTPPVGPTLPYYLLVGAAVVLAVVASLAYLYRGRLRTFVGPVRTADHDSAEETGALQSNADTNPMEEPLLSDEERVTRLLASRGGRMKQVEIVETTDWSNAKVSQLLSEMEEDGRVDKLRIGRENLISLPGQGPGDE